MINGLTPPRLRILILINESVRRRGYAPTTRELCDALGYASTNAVADVVRPLIRDGYLEKLGFPGMARRLRVTAAGRAKLPRSKARLVDVQPVDVCSHCGASTFRSHPLWLCMSLGAYSDRSNAAKHGGA